MSRTFLPAHTAATGHRRFRGETIGHVCANHSSIAGPAGEICDYLNRGLRSSRILANAP